MQSIRNLRYLELFTNVARAFCSTIQKWKNFVLDRDKTAFSLPTNWGDFYKTDNADRRGFIKCLHFKRDKLAFSLPSKWETNFFENWVPFFALFALVVLWGTFLRKAGAAKKFESKWEKRRDVATVYIWGGNQKIQIDLSVFGVPCPSVIMKGHFWTARKIFLRTEFRFSLSLL